MRGEDFVRDFQKSARRLLGRKNVCRTGGERKGCRQITYGWMPIGAIALFLGLCSHTVSVRNDGNSEDIFFHSDNIPSDGQEIRRGGDIPSERAGQEGAEKTEGLSGFLRLAGSSSMERLASALAEGFMEEYPDVTVTIEYVGSAAGIEAVLNGSADIGNSSRTLKAQELARGAVENIIGTDNIAVCVDPANRIEGLTLDQLADIYTGRITNWQELGGDNMPIVVVGHEAGSGTREEFEELLGIKDKCVYANELNSMGAVKARAALIPGAIGYISCEVLDDSVKVLALNGAYPLADGENGAGSAASGENGSGSAADGGNGADSAVSGGNGSNPAADGENGAYPLRRPFVMVTKGKIDEQNELVKAWFAYVNQVQNEERE